jgi:hypothetical protein
MARTQGVLDWFRPPESKTLHPVWWDYVEDEWSSRPPYMAASSGSVTDFGKATFCNYGEDPAILGSTGGAAAVI